MSRTISFSENTYIADKPIIVYGASVYGELAYIALEQMGIFPDYYCDKSRDRKEYFGIEVISPERLVGFKDANIMIASADFFYEIKKMLEDMGCINLFDMAEMLLIELPMDRLSNRAKEMYANRQHYMDIVQNQSDDQLVFNRIQYVVSERCSLKCKDCSHLIQYYKHPQDINLDRYKEAFDLMLEQTDYIAELRILGGEPFMNTEMHKLIGWYHNCDKIGCISIYTNGTIIPKEPILQTLQKEKVKLHISDYKVNADKIEKLIKVLNSYRIQYFVRTYDAWQDAGGVEFRDYTKEQRRAMFSVCFERSGYTFLKGKLFRCPREAHAMNLKVMPEVKEDYVDLLYWHGTKSELRQQMKKLQEREWLEGCNYCNGPDNHVQSIPAGQQITQPVEYETIEI